MKYSNEQLQEMAKRAIAMRETVDYIGLVFNLAIRTGVDPGTASELIDRMAGGDFSFDPDRT